MVGHRLTSVQISDETWREIHQGFPIADEAKFEETSLDIVQCLEAYSDLRAAGVDAWRKKRNRESAVDELEDLRFKLEEALRALDNLSPQPAAAFYGLFHGSNPLGRFVGQLDNPWGGAFRLKLRPLIGEVDQSRVLLQVVLPSNENGIVEHRVVPLLPPETLNKDLKQRARLAELQAKRIREMAPVEGHHLVMSDLAVIMRLAEIWRRYTGCEVSITRSDKTTERSGAGGPFLRWARVCAKVVNPDFNGEGALKTFLNT